MSDQIEIVDILEGEEIPEPVGILTDEQLEDLGNYLKKEYDAATAERDKLMQRARKWRTNMEALASHAPKNHPYKNSSNVTVPVTQTLGQSLMAMVLGTFDAREPLWDIQSIQPVEEQIKRFKVVGKYLNMLAKSPTDLNMPVVLQDLAYETILIGGSFPKVTWTTESWRIKKEDGTDVEVTYHDGPSVIVLPIERVKYRRGVNSISRLPWIANDTPLTEMELRKRASEQIYDMEGVQKILDRPRSTANEDEAQRDEAETFDSGEVASLYDITEFWVFYDVDDTGVPVDLFVSMHVESGTILRVGYNTLGIRCITNAKYIHRPGGLMGRGVGQLTESSQDEVTAIHNMRNDNMKLANTRLIVTKRGGPIKSNEEIWGGKILHADNPREDVMPFQLGEIYPSSLQSESNSMGYAQKAVGLSDSMMGFADQTLKTRDTVRGQAMRIGQGDSILGSAVAGMRDVISQIGMLVWIQCVANKERVISKERTAMRLTEEEIALLEEALDMSVEEVPMKMVFTVKVTDAERTFEQQRMNLMTMTQLFAQYGQQVVPLAMQIYGPQGQQLQQQSPELYGFLGRILVGSSKILEDIFKFFNITNTKDYVPDSDKMDQMLDMMQSAIQGISGAMPQGQMVPSQAQGVPPQGQIPSAMAAGMGEVSGGVI